MNSKRDKKFLVLLTSFLIELDLSPTMLFTGSAMISQGIRLFIQGVTTVTWY